MDVVPYTIDGDLYFGTSRSILQSVSIAIEDVSPGRYAMARNKSIALDDGFRLDLMTDATFDGILEIPCLSDVSEIRIPERVIPFSLRTRTKDYHETVVFYENDREFAEFIRAPELFTDELGRFSGGVVSPDCSLYRDSPLVVQLANTYRNRVLAFVLQKHGLYVIPNVRWGDERSYTCSIFPEKFAFLGIPRNSIVSVGTYGCCRGRVNKYHFKAGLEAMLSELHPKVVMVYGSMPCEIFGSFERDVQFVHFDDWTSFVHEKEVDHGQR